MLQKYMIYLHYIYYNLLLCIDIFKYYTLRFKYLVEILFKF